MHKRFTCANGHEWDTPPAGGLAVAAIACPTCGAPADTVVSFGRVHADPTVPGPQGPSGPPTSRPATQGGSATRPGEFGRYEIQEELGQGGMGRVYKAFDRELRRVIALKVPHFQPHDSEGLQRFKQEAQAAATFNHPNLCPVFDVGEHNGTLYLTMPFISGQSLAAILDATREAGKRLPERQVALVIRKLALALEHAHRKGVVHRDLKPDNIMIQRQEGAQEPLIMDFGLARREGTDTRLTATGVVMGTPGYMAPEQAAGLTKDTGPAGDVYSLGVILYELLTLRLPFEPPAILYKIVHEPPDPPSKHRPNLDPALEQICLRCLQKLPERRFGSMKELAGALTAWVKANGKGRGLPGETVPPGAGLFAELAREKPSRRRRYQGPLWYSLLAGAVAAAVLMAGVIVHVNTDYGTIKIELSESAADVQIKVDGGVVTVTSPDGALTLRAGKHHLEVVSDKFQTVARSFTLKRGRNDALTVTLEPKPAAGSKAEAEGAGKAPAAKPPAWRPLFNGKDLAGWVGKAGGPAAWKVENGYLEVIPGQGNIWTEERFGDFELSVEFWIPPLAEQNRFRGNSGIFLQGRYEIQVLDSFDNPTRPEGACGALYGQIAPSQNASKSPGQWQSFDITFRSPRVGSRGAVTEKGRLTVLHNGVKVIDDVTFDKATPLALDDKQGTPGPVLLQDHGSLVRFRNLKIKPLSEATPVGKSPSAPLPAIPDDAVSFDGHRYKFFAEQLTWKEAGARCAGLGGHLVVIDSAAENRFVAGLVDKAGWLDTWIGITDEAQEGDWRTVEGKPLRYTNWFPNQPNNKGGVEHYGLLSNRTFGRPLGWTWCDQPNESKEHVPGYVCEWDRSR